MFGFFFCFPDFYCHVSGLRSHFHLTGWPNYYNLRSLVHRNILNVWKQQGKGQIRGVSYRLKRTSALKPSSSGTSAIVLLNTNKYTDVKRICVRSCWAAILFPESGVRNDAQSGWRSRNQNLPPTPELQSNALLSQVFTRFRAARSFLGFQCLGVCALKCVCHPRNPLLRAGTRAAASWLIQSHKGGSADQIQLTGSSYESLREVKQPMKSNRKLKRKIQSEEIS